MFVYVAKITLVAAAFVGVMAGFNRMVDPYWIHGADEKQAPTSEKQALNTRIHLFKWGRLARGEPEVVVLGSSRSLVGVDTRHLALQGRKAVNLAFSSQSVEESWYLLEYLSRRKAPALVLMGLDFESDVDCWASLSGPARKNDSDWLTLELLLARSTLVDSFRTLLRLGAVEHIAWVPTGEVIQDREFIADRGGARAMFVSNENSYETLFKRRKLSCDFGGSASMGEYASYLRKIVALAYSAGIDLRLFIHPVHVQQWEIFAAMGLENHSEQWRRMLMKMLEEEAHKASRPAFQLWDFGGYNEVTMEEPPPVGSTKGFMEYYFDASHYLPRVGSMVTSRILRQGPAEQQGPADFGVLLSPQNLEQQLRESRRKQAQWRQRHPEDVRRIHERMSGPEKPTP